jgi:diguanylate cyclase (GGDEF)-like protein
MIEGINAAVVVNDREIRDLICLNLRFESIKTEGYTNLNEFINSQHDFTLAIIDLCGERDPKSRIARIFKAKRNLPLILLVNGETSPFDADYVIEIDQSNGRKRFDASKLISLVNELVESRRDEPSKHPLTGLPSGSVVEKHIISLLACERNFTLIASDMDNMKGFNQRFGYAEGDNLLIAFVNLMRNILDENTDTINFIGHRGEDDFVIITSPNQALKVAERIVDGFDEMVKSFFSPADLDNGYFTVKNRRGDDVKFPLTTVSLVIINTEGRYFSHPAELYDVAEELMSQVKARGISQSYCAVDKRIERPEPRNMMI